MTVEMSNVVGPDSCNLSHTNMADSSGAPSSKSFPPNPGNLPLRRILKPGDPNYGQVHQSESSDGVINPELLLTSPDMEIASPEMETIASAEEVSARMNQLQISRESSPIPHLIICEEADNEDFLNEDDDAEYGGYREAADTISDFMEGASLSRSSSSLSVPPIDVIDEGKRPPQSEGEDGETGASWTPC